MVGQHQKLLLDKGLGTFRGGLACDEKKVSQRKGKNPSREVRADVGVKENKGFHHGIDTAF